MSNTAHRHAVVRLVATLAAVAVGACHGDAVSSTPPPEEGSRLLAIDGDQVNGEPGADDAEPLTVRLLTTSGKPIPGVAITWSATDGGSVQQETAQTDRAGFARASWIFGDQAASQTAIASVGAAQVSFHGWLRESPPIPIDTLRPLELTTYEGSGQVVHPDVIFLPRSWDGGDARLAMAITPYPYGDPSRENPSLFVSDGGAAWKVLAAGQNPIELPTNGYLSDPALVFDQSSHQLRLYYRQVADGYNVIWLVTSADGLQWSAPRQAVRVPSHWLISPTVVRRSATDWLMWSVNGGVDGCGAQDASVELRRSSDGIVWRPPVSVALNQDGGYPWHIDVKWIAPLHQYWALYNLKTPGNCVTPAIYLATSPDGVQWTTYPRPVLQRGAIPAFAHVVYRSSFVYTKADDMVTFYISGARWDGARYVWSAAIQRRSRTALFSDLQAPGTVTLRRARSDLPSPEGSVGRPRPNR